MHIEGEPVVAFCYIKKEGDTKNACYLTKENLYIRYKNKLSSFSNDSVLGIAFEHKILLFPLISGGIITPLSVHGLLHSYSNPWLLLLLMFLGLVLMYFGWQGSTSMTIKTSIKDYDFFIRQTTPNLKAFAEFVQHYISADERGRMFYFTKEHADWQHIKNNEYLPVGERLILWNWREIKEQKHGKDTVILGIDPIASNVEIKFIQTAGQKLQAIVTDNIPVLHIHELTGRD